jgi:putrescine transport system permease protein
MAPCTAPANGWAISSPDTRDGVCHRTALPLAAGVLYPAIHNRAQDQPGRSPARRSPYSPLWQILEDSTLQIQLHLENYRRLWEDPLYTIAYLKSLRIAGISTLVCLLLGYPMAYAIARTRDSLRNLLLMLIILPFWTSFLIRVYAWIGNLKSNGLLKNLLLYLGVIDRPLPLLHTDFAVYLGIVYSYLPFMVLPLYAILSRMDLTLLEAAADLGCRPWKAFLKVTLPLSLPGIIAGCMLVFIPAVGEFVIPDLLGGPDSLMIGKVLWTEFFFQPRLAGSIRGGGGHAGAAGSPPGPVPAGPGKEQE